MKDRYTYLLCYISALAIYCNVLLNDDFRKWLRSFLENKNLVTSDGAPVFWSATVIAFVLDFVIVLINQRNTSPKNIFDTFLASTSMILLAFISAWIIFFIVLASGKIGG